jgi:NDP-sugar pyrophosphorylase family protein
MHPLRPTQKAGIAQRGQVSFYPSKAMILAAGFGARLWPLTIGRTKPALPFLNRPLIAQTIDYLRRYGITDLIINLHHEPASIREQIGDGSRFGVRIEYSVEEPAILGTAGALDAVRDQLSGGPFIVINGKILTDLDLGAAIATHHRAEAIATLILRRNADREHFREVLVDERGWVRGFGDFPLPETTRLGEKLDDTEAPVMFTGIHILEPEILDWIPRGVPSDSVRDVYPRLIAAGRTIAGHIGTGAWYELSTLARYHSISLAFRQSAGDDSIFGEGCQIDPSARVERSVLWRGVVVGREAQVTDCILGDGVIIPSGATYHGVAIVPAAILSSSAPPEKSLPGKIEGQNLVVPFLE